MLQESGELVGEPTPVNRAVKFFEKGERPVEIITSRQWFIRTVAHHDALISAAGSCAGIRPTCGPGSRTG